MHDPVVTYAILCVAAFFAGAINSIAGGGTLLTFPVLLAIISPVAANATSTVALLPGSLAGAWGYRAELQETRHMFWILFFPSLAGGALGALAVTHFPERVFATLVPWLLLVASLLLTLQKPIGRWLGSVPHEAPHGRTVAIIAFFQFLVGIYGGYFGAGIGILMLSSLAFMGIPDIHRMNGLKTVLAVVINGVTVIVFMLAGAVVWKYAAAMAVTSIAGGYAGARVARRMPAARVRMVVVCIGFAVAAYSFYKRFA